MYRQMRRQDRAMPDEAARELLIQGEYGILSTVGADGQPWGVPLSYVVMDDHIYFHCAHEGQKVDNIAHEARVSFCVVGRTKPVYQGTFTTQYESVAVYGTASKVEDEKEWGAALTALVDKYLPQHREKAPESIRKFAAATDVYRIRVLHMTGKELKAPPA